MQQEFITKTEVISAIAKVSDIDLQKTLCSFDYCFVTKDGREYQTPNFHFFIRALIEHADAQLKVEECFELPFVTLLSFVEKETAVKDAIDKNVSEVAEVQEEVKQEPKPRGRTKTK